MVFTLTDLSEPHGSTQHHDPAQALEAPGSTGTLAELHEQHAGKTTGAFIVAKAMGLWIPGLSSIQSAAAHIPKPKMPIKKVFTVTVDIRDGHLSVTLEVIYYHDPDFWILSHFKIMVGPWNLQERAIVLGNTCIWIGRPAHKVPWTWCKRSTKSHYISWDGDKIRPPAN